MIALDEVIKDFYGTEDVNYRVELGMLLCDSFFSKNSFRECLQYGLETIELCQAIGEVEILIKIMCRIGNSYMVQGVLTEAREYFIQALNLSLSNNKPFEQGLSYINLGAIEYNSGNFHLAIENYIKAVNIFDIINTDNEKMISEIMRNREILYSNIALCYLVYSRFSEALDWNKKALRVNMNHNKPETYFSTGYCYEKIGDECLALGYYQRSLKQSINSSNFIYENFNKIAIAEIYVNRKKYNEAIPLLNEAIEYCEQNNLYEHSFISFVLLGNIYCFNHDPVKCEFYYNKAFQILDRIQNPHQIMSFYQGYSKVCFLEGRYQDAYTYLEKSFDLNLDIFKENLLENTTFLTTKFETEQKKQELEIYRLKNVELVNSHKIIEQKNDELLKINETKDNILGMISHDLKNYIGSALSAHELLLIKDSTLHQNKYVKMIYDSNNKALTLVKDILYMNKMEIDTNDLELSPQDINTTIENLLENLRLMANRKNISIVDELFFEPLRCMINTDKFHRVVDNLVINAIKFTPKEGKIIVKTNRINEIVYIHIVDSGIGMDNDLLSKLFMQYSKAGRKGTEGEESTGLGLYIVKTIIEKHQGKIRVYSEVGKGSEFVIELPYSP